MVRVILLAVGVLLVTNSAFAQSCNPAAAYYMVRDETGKLLDEEQTKQIEEQLPKQVGDANISAGQVSLASDPQTFYWEESIEWKKGTKLPALAFANAATCTMKLDEVTLSYQGKKMTLKFNLSISRNQLDRRPVIDSLPFQEGTFALDLSDWPHLQDKIIPATRWKKLK